MLGGESTAFVSKMEGGADLLTIIKRLCGDGVPDGNTR